MTTSLDLLNAVMAKTGAPSDYAVSKILGVTNSAISLWRCGRGTMSNEIALKVAQILEIDQSMVLAIVQCERAKTPAEKSAWQLMFEQHGGQTLKLPTLPTTRDRMGTASSSLYIM